MKSTVSNHLDRKFEQSHVCLLERYGTLVKTPLQNA